MCQQTVTYITRVLLFFSTIIFFSDKNSPDDFCFTAGLPTASHKCSVQDNGSEIQIVGHEKVYWNIQIQTFCINP
jgi:hypothetical protein